MRNLKVGSDILNLMQRGFAPILIILLVAIILGIGGYFAYSSRGVAPKAGDVAIYSTPAPIESTSLADTSNWKTYNGETVYTSDGSSSFEIKYPSGWQIEGNVLYPLGKNSDKGLETKIVLGAGGSDGVPEGFVISKKQFSSGISDYFWGKPTQFKTVNSIATFSKGQNSYIFEVFNIPAERDLEFQKIFDQMLNSFKFTQ